MSPKIFKVVIVALLLSLEAYAFPAVQSMNSDTVVWIALFALSVMGIFALYISSGQVDAISEKYNTVQQNSHDVKVKHDVVLNVLNDRLKNSTIGIQRHRELMEELAVSNPDLQILQREAKRIKRDERILQEAIKDIEHFKSIQEGKLLIESKPFALYDLLDKVAKDISPYLMVKRNQFDYTIDPGMPQTITGDVGKLEKILGTIIVEMGNEVSDEIISMSVSQDKEQNKILFSLTMSASKDMNHFGEIISEDELDGSQHSIRMLKNYIAFELIKLMDGVLTYEEYAGTKCLLALPNNNL